MSLYSERVLRKKEGCSVLHINREGQRGIMVAELEHQAVLLLRRVAKLDSDIRRHLAYADQLEKSMERFSIADDALFRDVRQRIEQLGATLHVLHEHWLISAAIVDHDIMGSMPEGAGNERKAEDSGGGEAKGD